MDPLAVLALIGRLERSFQAMERQIAELQAQLATKDESEKAKT